MKLEEMKVVDITESREQLVFIAATAAILSGDHSIEARPLSL